jgi:transposase-like protein
VWQNCGTNPTAPADRYKNYRFPADIISHAVWLYFRQEMTQRFHLWHEITGTALAA